MTRQHRLNEIKRFAATDLTDDDAVRTHAECRPEQLTYRYCAVPARIGWLRLESDHVGKTHLKLCRVLDYDHALIGARDRHQGVEERGFPGAAAPADDDISPAIDEPVEQGHDLCGDRTELEKAF